MSLAATEDVIQSERLGSGPTHSSSSSSSEPWAAGSPVRPPVPGGAPAWHLGPRPILQADTLGGKAHLASQVTHTQLDGVPAPKRRRLQDKAPISNPEASYPAIFARSERLAKRFPHLSLSSR